MKLVFLGTGSAFTVGDNFNSNMLLEHDNGKRLLIDCGSDVRHALHKLGLNYNDVNDVYVSHAHADHAGGLEWLGFTHKFHPGCHRPNLYLNEDLASFIWEKTLSGGMQSIKEYESNLETYFDVHPIPTNHGQFQWEGIPIDIIQAIHIHHDHQLMPCYGIMLNINGKHIYITADTQFTPEHLQPYYDRADLIFQDCETLTKCRSGVHAHFSDLCTLPADVKAKMWLYHYNPGPLPECRAHGFKGFVKPGQTFDLKDERIYRRGE